MKYLVQYSGGLQSFECARRVIEKHGKENVELWFADTMDEDEDLYRFNRDVEKLLGVKIRVFCYGMNLWELFDSDRFIANSRADICSRKMKRELLQDGLVDYKGSDITIVLGMDWQEPHRIKKAEKFWVKYNVVFPLNDSFYGPFIFNNKIEDYLKENGIEIPRMYKLGFSHNNCGGACVKAGKGQWVHLLKTLPDRFKYHEERERESGNLKSVKITPSIRLRKKV